ncbi:hypothetical protein OXX80_014320 [Metschnikowia pulcherrima]
MFKKFGKAEIHSRSNIKSSAQRGLKSNFVAQYEALEPIIDTIIPKNHRRFWSSVRRKSCCTPSMAKL